MLFDTNETKLSVAEFSDSKNIFKFLFNIAISDNPAQSSRICLTVCDGLRIIFNVRFWIKIIMSGRTIF